MTADTAVNQSNVDGRAGLKEPNEVPEQIGRVPHSAAGGSRDAFQFLATGFTPAITSTAVFSAFPAFVAW